NEDGGSVNSAIAWANKAIERTTDNTILVPGHGPVGNRAQLIEFRDMLVTVRDKVVALKSQGKSLEDIIAAKPTAAFDDKWGRLVMDSKFFTKLVYDSIAASPSPWRVALGICLGRRTQARSARPGSLPGGVTAPRRHIHEYRPASTSPGRRGLGGSRCVNAV